MKHQHLSWQRAENYTAPLLRADESAMLPCAVVCGQCRELVTAVLQKKRAPEMVDRHIRVSTQAYREGQVHFFEENPQFNLGDQVEVVMRTVAAMALLKRNEPLVTRITDQMSRLSEGGTARIILEHQHDAQSTEERKQIAEAAKQILTLGFLLPVMTHRVVGDEATLGKHGYRLSKTY